MNRVFIAAYLLLLGLHIWLGHVQNTFWEHLTKPVLVLSLLFYFLAIHRRRANWKRFSVLILFALVCSLAGDVLLMFQEENSSFFVAGLGAFLVAHILYIWAFTLTYRQDHEIALIKKYGYVMVAVVAYGFVFFNQIKDHLGSMVGPVMVYTMAITLMLLIALNRFKRVGMESFWYIAAGALFFIASDSLLAWNKFVEPIPFDRILIMGTYGLAQLGIVLGAGWQVRDVRGGGMKWVNGVNYLLVFPFATKSSKYFSSSSKVMSLMSLLILSLMALSFFYQAFFSFNFFFAHISNIHSIISLAASLLADTTIRLIF